MSQTLPHPDPSAVVLLADALDDGAPAPDSWDFPLALDVLTAVAPDHPAIPPALLRLLSSPADLPAPVALQILHRALAALPPDASSSLLAQARPLLALLWLAADAPILDALRLRVPELLSLPIPEPARLLLGRSLLDSPRRRSLSLWADATAALPPPPSPLHAAARSLLLAEAARRRERRVGPRLARASDFLARRPVRAALLLAAPLLLLAAVGTVVAFLRPAPPSPLPPLQAAAALSSDSRHAEAAETLLRAVASATPDEAPLLRFRAANALLRAGRPAEAESIYRSLLPFHPSHPTLLLNLAASLVRQNRPADAIPLYQSILDLPPSRTTPSAVARATAALDLLRRREASRAP